jgi:hypothetical protein
MWWMFLVSPMNTILSILGLAPVLDFTGSEGILGPKLLPFQEAVWQQSGIDLR